MKKLFLMAAMAAMVLVACDKGPGAGSKQSGKARMNVVISFPEAMGTRAGDTNASDKDVAVESVTVFVFDEEGNGVLGNGSSFVLADFEDVGNNTYELNPLKRVQTTAGPKHVYVGINLPDGLKSAASENDLVESASTAGLESESSVAMLSGLATPTLEAQQTEDEQEQTPTANIVATEVQRLVAKIAVSAGSQTSFTPNSGQVNGATFTVTPDQFAVGGLATTFYPVQRITGGMLETPGDAVDASEPTLRAINASGTAVDELDAFYVPEHADMSRTYVQSALTHVVVRAEVNFAKWAVMGSEGVEFENVATLSPESIVYVFRSGDDTYFCKTASAATQIKNELEVTAPNEVYAVDNQGKIYTFYHLFLNKDEADMLAVKRNQFFDIKITGAKGLGLVTATAPDEPLVETTYLEVSVDVLAWDYKAVNQVLGE